MVVRKAVFAGSFYPKDPKELKEMVDGFLKEAKEVKLPRGAKLKAIIVPHAGYIYSGIVAASGYRLLKALKLLKKIIITGPSHNEIFPGVRIDNSDYWESPLGKVKIQKSKVKSEELFYDSKMQEGEHSIEVQVPFLQRTLTGFEIVPILLGEVEAGEVANNIYNNYKNYKDEEKIIIVSSDLSHYYPYDQAVKIDSIANDAIPNLDILTVEKEVEACGKTGILALMHLAKQMGWKGIFIDYKNSGDLPAGRQARQRVVGYGCYGFYD
jgi:MEMO1 family protein